VTGRVRADIAGDYRDPLGHERVEVGSQSGAQPIERVVLQDFASDALGRRCSATMTDEEDDVAVRHAVQEAFDEGCPHESGCSRHGYAPTAQGFCDHVIVLSQVSTKW
jgi:hypothetical protein